MMSNEHGYFKYFGVIPQEKSTIGFTTNIPLQETSDVGKLKKDVFPLNYSSFEQNEYNTENPKILYRNDKFQDYEWTSNEIIRWKSGPGFVTTETSDENGILPSKVQIKATLNEYYTFPGITIRTMNKLIIPYIKIIGYDKSDNVVVEEEVYLSKAHEISHDDLNYVELEIFYSLNLDTVKSVVVEFEKIEKPHHFLWITGIDFGEISIFDETNLVDVEINNFVSVLGDTLEYDTADISIFAPDENEHLFFEKQMLKHFKGFDENGDEVTKGTYFIDKGVSNGDGTMSIRAYGSTSLLETTFYGGMYENYPLKSIIDKILEGTNIKYSVMVFPSINLTGYLPISSRRNALKTVLLASNVRCFRNGDSLVFKPISKELKADVLNETNIVSNPQITDKKPVDEIKIKHHSYKKNTSDDDMVELFNGELERFTETLITFNSPVHWLVAYEIIGVDEDGNDVIADTPISNTDNFRISLLTENACKVFYTGTNNVVIYGKEYIISDFWFVKQREKIATNKVYDTVTIDLPIKADLNAVATELLELYSRPKSIRFLTTKELEIGGYYNILGENLNVKSIKNSFNGLYEVEAV
jgi:hypothetical protein